VKELLRNGGGWTKWAAAAFGGGAGVVLASQVIELLKAQPGLLAMQGWPATVAVITVAGLVIVNHRAGQGIRAVREMAEAQKGLTEAVHQLAGRDNEQLVVMQALMEETGDRTKRILKWIELEEERREQAERAKREAFGG
jgi:hypothetical protein